MDGTDSKKPLEEGDDLEALDRLGPVEGTSREPLTRHAPTAKLPARAREDGPAMASTQIRPLPPGVEASLELDDAQGLVKLARTVTVLGRAESGADVVLPVNEEASREHAALLFVAGKFFLEDLRSENGTFVNDQRVQRVALRSGDRIGIGSQVLVFHSRTEPPRRRR